MFLKDLLAVLRARVELIRVWWRLERLDVQDKRIKLFIAIACPLIAANRR